MGEELAREESPESPSISYYLLTKVIQVLVHCSRSDSRRSQYITKTCLLKYTENFPTKKWKFSDKKNSEIFHISAQNIDCGYSLEPPCRGDSNEYIPTVYVIEQK